jgi:Asp-tRNA(Asn)/Glu-tRNA(Gln) amidotransferase C subunit
MNTRLRSEEKSVKIFANDLQNLLQLDEKLKNFEKRSKKNLEKIHNNYSNFSLNKSENN